MINAFLYFIIGFIQGITEFLPISSSGHIVMIGSFFSLDNLLLISVVAHIGTLFAVIFCYRKRLGELFGQFGRDVGSVFKREKLIPNENRNIYINLIIATIPTVVIVLLFNKFLEANFAVHTLVWGFLISSVLLIIADLKKENNKPLNKRNAFFMGLAQGCALLPGISRSGSTLVCGLLLGVNKEKALDFSFLMSIPIIIASAVYEGVKLFSCQLSINWAGIFIVMITSFIFGILSIKIMLKLVNKNKLYYFAIYLIALSLVLLIFF